MPMIVLFFLLNQKTEPAFADELAEGNRYSDFFVLTKLVT